MKKIIVVEDEQILLKALSIELLSAGFQVITAANGEAGLQLIQKEHPDMALLDITMPKLNGFEVLKKLKDDPATKAIPVIVLSNMGQDEDRKKGLDLGAIDYFVKSSTDLTVLSNKIKALLS